MLLVFSVLSAGLGLLYRTNEKSLVKRHEKDLKEAALFTDNLVELRAKEMMKLVLLFQANRPLIEYIYLVSELGSAAAPLRETLEPMYKALGLDEITLYNSGGKALLHLGKRKNIPQKTTGKRFPEKIIYGFKENEGIPMLAGAGPLTYSGKTIGYIEIGRYMDEEFFSELRGATGGEIFYLRNGIIEGSSMGGESFPFLPSGGKFDFKGQLFSFRERNIKNLYGGEIGTLVTALSDRDLSASLLKMKFYLLVIILSSMLVAYALGTLMIRALVNPIMNMAQFVKKIGSGRFDSKLKVEGKDEIAFLSERFNLMQDQIKLQKQELESYAGNMEKMVEERTGELQETQRQLLQSQKMESLGALAGGISHDFNNLLTVILGYASFARESLSPEDEQYRYWDIVEKAALRGVEVTSNLLTFSRGKPAPAKRGPVNINQLVTELLKLLENSFDKKINIEQRLSPLELYVSGESTAIYQALLNICINARDSMPDGGRLIIETGLFTPTQEFLMSHPQAREGPYVRIEVADNGIGIQKEIIDRIFEPFFTTKGKERGTGLGLAIVYGIVKEYDGFIDVLSEPGKWTIFRICFPLIEPDEEKLSLTSCPKPESAINEGEGILVVDDETQVRGLYRKVLESANYRVYPAPDGDTAIRILKGHEDEISLAILDLILPKMDGYEILKNLKAIKPLLKVVVASGYSPESGLEWLENETEGSLQKPFSPVELLQTVKQALA